MKEEIRKELDLLFQKEQQMLMYISVDRSREEICNFAKQLLAIPNPDLYLIAAEKPELGEVTRDQGVSYWEDYDASEIIRLHAQRHLIDFALENY